MIHYGDITQIKGSDVPVWASEIEEFPIAVTKIRFPEDEDGRKNC